MINSKFRFHGRGSLSAVYAKGKTVRAENLSLKFASLKTGDYRLAVVVSKKVSKSAVVRNRIRRRLYEAVRVAKQEHDKRWSQQLIITVHHQELATIPAKELTARVASLLKKAKII